MTNQNTASQDRAMRRNNEVSRQELIDGVKTWWSTMAECHEEVGRFVSDRLAKDGEYLRQSLTCRDWTEALDVQARWMEETLRDYNSEMRKLTDLYANATATSSAVQDKRRAA